MRWDQGSEKFKPMDWNRFFCWYPVDFKGQWVWFEWLQRKRVYRESFRGVDWESTSGWWEYREDSPLEERG